MQPAVNNTLDFRGIFAHAWDLADDGVEPVLASVAELGLNTLCVAGTYHSGWFIHPHSRSHRMFMTEGSACYFHPETRRYNDTKIKPIVAAICEKRDWLADAGKTLDRYNLRMVSWTIGTHNTRQGLLHPTLTQQNVFGDRLPFALCISNPDVQAYLLALCADLANNYPMWGLQLESFGWMSIAHNHHHERDLTGLTPMERELMSLCVCPACADTLRREQDIDISSVVALIKSILDATFANAPDRPAGHPQSIAEIESRSPEFKRFLAWRKKFANRLIARIKTESLKGTACKLLLQIGFDPDLANVVDGFACGAYGQEPQAVAQTCRNAVASIPPTWNGLMQCFIRLGMGIPRSEQQLREIVDVVTKSGCNGINFYNRSESPPRMLSWLKSALAGQIR